MAVILLDENGKPIVAATGAVNTFTQDYQGQVELNTNARHTHANKTILDNTTASFTIADKDKINNTYNKTEVENLIQGSSTSIVLRSWDEW
jgi:hypothetical protein